MSPCPRARSPSATSSPTTAASPAQAARVLSVSGKTVGSGRIEHTIPFIFSVETADVGRDLYTPVTRDYKKGDNSFTGTINRVTIDLNQGSAEHADPAGSNIHLRH
jgi:hypothetical protein